MPRYCLWRPTVSGSLPHHLRAFRKIYKFIAGREPDRTAIAPEVEVKLSGLVRDTPGGVQTNRPVAGAPAMWCCSTARSRPMCVPTDSASTLRLSAAETGRPIVQSGAHRGAGVAGIGKQDCDRRADLLAVWLSPICALSWRLDIWTIRVRDGDFGCR